MCCQILSTQNVRTIQYYGPFTQSPRTMLNLFSKLLDNLYWYLYWWIVVVAANKYCIATHVVLTLKIKKKEWRIALWWIHGRLYHLHKHENKWSLHENLFRAHNTAIYFRHIQRQTQNIPLSEVWSTLVFGEESFLTRWISNQIFIHNWSS